MYCNENGRSAASRPPAYSLHDRAALVVAPSDRQLQSELARELFEAERPGAKS
jgi:hypothetical protein